MKKNKYTYKGGQITVTVHDPETPRKEFIKKTAQAIIAICTIAERGERDY